MTRILIVAASRHGATDEIAEEVAGRLRQEMPGAEVVVRRAAEPGELDGSDAVLVGSAIYLGKWLPAARRFVEGHRVGLAAVPVWLFSSGPVGDPPEPVDDLAEVTALGVTLGARGGPSGSRCAPCTPPRGTSATTTPSGRGRTRWPRTWAP